MQERIGRDFTRSGGVKDLSTSSAQEGASAGLAGFFLDLLSVHGAFASALWLVGVVCTMQAVQLLVPGQATAFIVAFILQGGFTLAESPIWRRVSYDERGMAYQRQRPSAISWLALGLDASLNLVGTWAVVGRVHELGFVQAIGAMFDTAVAPITGFPALILSFGLAILLCAIPEKIWSAD